MCSVLDYSVHDFRATDKGNNYIQKLFMLASQSIIDACVCCACSGVN